jgi:hypothetical protein
MGDDLLLGIAVMVVCVMVQCFVVMILFRVLLFLENRQLLRPDPIKSTALLTAVMLIMLAGTFAQIAVWAAVFQLGGEFADFATAFYHSTVNFATLGYGDIVMSEEAPLLGALEAVNGVMMFGLTTGVLVTVLNAIARRGWKARVG